MFELFAFASSGFWMLMIFDCVRNEPDRQTWLWILIFLNVAGAFIYFVARVVPRLNIPQLSIFKRWTLGQKLWEAEAAMRNIGKAHQHVAYANLLIEVGEWEGAKMQYQQALEKDVKHIDALWGMAQVTLHQKDLEAARTHLEALLQLDPKHKYGDASLAYGKVLYNLEQWDLAEAHLSQDLKEWSHPEAAYLLAQIYLQNGDRHRARNTLETMMFKVKASPKFHYKRNRATLRKAEKVLKTLSV